MNAVRIQLFVSSSMQSAFNKFSFKRAISHEIRKKMKEKSAPKVLALEYFDFYYGTTFGSEWNKMRLAMLTGKSKPIALLNNYATNQLEILKKFERLTALDLLEFSRGQHLKYLSEKQQRNNTSETNEMEFYSSTSNNGRLRAFCFDVGNTSRFPAPKYDLPGMEHEGGGLLSYYCMDGASLLPVLALELGKNQTVLDLCSSPGGKAISVIQTLLPSRLVCRDNTDNRLGRLERTLRSYLPKFVYENLVKIELNESPQLSSLLDQQKQQQHELFDRVLCDVPCSNDRQSLFKEDNNIFARSRNAERAELPKKQTELLTQAVLMCKHDGLVVYSTCSLSPTQNEGVVNNVLKMFNENQSRDGGSGGVDFKLVVEPLEQLKSELFYFYKFSRHCQLGLLAIPEINRNFGPLYVCKLRKVKLQE